MNNRTASSARSEVATLSPPRARASAGGGSQRTNERDSMTSDERVGRLERAVVALTKTISRNYGVRPTDSSVADVQALRELVADVERLDEADASAGRRVELRRELDELGAR